MISRPERALGVAAALALVTLGGFAVAHGTAQAIEAHLTSALVSALGGGRRVSVVYGTSVLVLPHHGTPFRAVITPSCSSLASVLALGCLSLTCPKMPWTRRLLVGGVPMACVAAGNVIRLAASVAFGLVAGRASLVLFHDWVGGVVTFASTLGGYVLMLSLVLPSRERGVVRAA